jgi:hypothetical protein
MTKRVTRITTEEPSIGITPFWDAVEKIGTQEITVNVNGGSSKMTLVEAGIAKLSQSALKGSPHSMRQFNKLQRENAELRKKEIDDECATWSEIQAYQYKEYARHRAVHDTDPLDFPHPDDIYIDPKQGVSIRGPINMDAYREMLTLIAKIDAYLWQDALEAVLDGRKSDARGQLRSPFLLAIALNGGLPRRLRLTKDELCNTAAERSRRTKRQLLKETHQAWCRAGDDIPRGTRLPSVGHTMKMMMLLNDAARIAIDKKIDRAEKERQLDELVQDTYGRAPMMRPPEIPLSLEPFDQC